MSKYTKLFLILTCYDTELEQFISCPRGMGKMGENMDIEHLEGKRCLSFAQEG